MKQVKTEFLSSKLVRFSKQISNANISAPRRDNPSKFSLRDRPESQLWRRHQNLYLLANQDDLTPGRFYYSGFITELQRFFCHIGNHGNRNGFGDLTFPIGFTLRITWSFLSYDHMIWLEHMWCGYQCSACPYVKETKDIKNKNFHWKINKHLSCSSYKIIYMLECKKKAC